MIEPRKPEHGILKIVLLYALFAGIWIWLSDTAVSLLFSEPEQIIRANMLKGWFFVAVTSALFYGLMRSVVKSRLAASMRENQLQAEKLRALQLLEAIAEGSDDAIFAKDIQGRYLLFNKACSRFLGKSPEEVLGKNDTEILPPADAETVIQLNRRILSENRVMRAENVVNTRNGPTVFLTTRGPLHDAQGSTIGIFGISRDITDFRNIEKELRQQRDFAETLIDTAQAIILVLAPDGRIVRFNSYMEQLSGWKLAEVQGKDWFSTFLPQPNQARTRELFLSAITDLKTVGNVDTLITRSGEKLAIEWYDKTLKDEEGRLIGLLSIGLNVTARAQAEEALRESEEHFRSVFEQVAVGMSMLTPEGKWIEVNQRLCDTVGYSREELMGMGYHDITPFEDDRALDAANVSQMIEGKQRSASWEKRYLRKDGQHIWVRITTTLIRDKVGLPKYFLSITEDITAHKHAEEQIHRLAFYDALTGLPNRTLLLDRIGMVLPIAQRQRRNDALLLFNVDRFKNINDASGQAVGDILLRAVGERLLGVLREGDVLARLSGDEFAILLPDLAHPAHAAAHKTMHVAEKIHASLREPFQVGEEMATLTASIGIALFPREDNDTPLDILRRANTALHESKSAGGAQTTLFERSMDENTKQRFRIERELRLAIPAGQLRLYLQPQVNAAGKIVGAEALVRWQHPERGLIPPGSFIPIAEESELIIEIGRWVFSQVCQLLTHEALFGRPYRISVNISPRQFRQPDFVSWVRNELTASGAEPTHLTFEVTEGVVIDNINSIVAKMNELTVMGIHFSIDDFGTGYSSLAYLKLLPIHELKIDKTFVQDAPTDPDDAALVETILAVAKHMHLKVVAEGVETEEQAEFLNQRGQVIHQGYLFGKPEPATQWEERIIAESRKAP